MAKIDFPPEMEVSESGAKDGGVGGTLQAFRMRRGVSLKDVSQVLRIRQVYLQAIEDGRFEELPGSIYSRGFVRAYAQYLGLDGDQIVERFKSENNALDVKPSLSFPAMVPDHGIPGGAILMLGLIVAAVGYGGWYFVSSKDGFNASAVSQPPQQLASELNQNSEPRSAIAAPTPVSTQVPTSTPVSTQVPTSAPGADQSLAPAIGETLATGETPADEAGTIETPGESGEKAHRVVLKAAAVPAEGTQSSAAPEGDATEGDATEGDNTNSAAGNPVPEAETPAVAETRGAARIGLTENAAPDQTPTSKVEKARASKVEKAREGMVAPPSGQAAPSPFVHADTADEQSASSAARRGDDGAKVEESAANAGQEAASESTVPQIIVRAKLDSWVQIRDDNANQLIMTRLMRVGDSYRVPKQPGLTLLTGNAGALEIIVDGQVVPSIGPPGTVRRHVALKADLLRRGAAVIE